MRTSDLATATIFFSAGLLIQVAIAQDFETADINLRVGTYVRDGKPISCPEGKQQLEDLGFQTVEVTNCSPESYTYRASRAGARYEVVITGKDGRIVRRTAF